MRHPIRPRLAATAAATTLAIGLGLSACGADDQPSSATGTPSASASGAAAPTIAGPTPGATGQPGGSGSGSGSGSGGDTGSGSGGDGPGQPPTGPPPRILRTTVEPYTLDGELVAEVIGHAYDDGGPDPQLRVARVEVQWGDGSTTAAQLGGNNVFRDLHAYDPSYRGRTVTVRIVAYGHAGRTTAESHTLPLPD